MALLAQALVVVRQIIDDREMTAGANEARRGVDRVLRFARMYEHARHHHEVGAAALQDLLGQRGILYAAFAQAIAEVSKVFGVAP